MYDPIDLEEAMNDIKDEMFRDLSESLIMDKQNSETNIELSETFNYIY